MNLFRFFSFIRFLSISLAFVLLSQSALPIFAQSVRGDVFVWRPQPLTPAPKKKAKQKSGSSAVGFLNIEPFQRSSADTVQSLLQEQSEKGKVDAYQLACVLADEAYIRSLSEGEAADLAWVCKFADVYSGSAAEEKLLDTVFSYLGVYDEKDKDFPLKSFYEMAAVYMGYNVYLRHKVFDRAFKNVQRDIQLRGEVHYGWQAALLADLAVEDEEGDSWAGEYYERFIESLINQTNWLSQESIDYKITGLNVSLGATNQSALIQLFAQANSFFAAKDGDSFLKSMITTGGFNGIGRALMSNDENQPQRFSDTGEVFYLSSPTPGTDGKGHFAETLNGRRHFMLYQLLQGLFLSYNSRDPAESSRLMQQFIRKKLEVNADKKFRSYLYIPLQAMHLGSALHDANSLDGWEKEEAALQAELYSKLKAGYKWQVTCTTVQGACEVTAEWILAGKALKYVFKGGGAVVRAGGRQIVKHMSANTLMRVAVAELALQQGKKVVFRWTRQGMQNVLKKCGWKAVTKPAASRAGKSAGTSHRSRRPR